MNDPNKPVDHPVRYRKYEVAVGKDGRTQYICIPINDVKTWQMLSDYERFYSDTFRREFYRRRGL